MNSPWIVRRARITRQELEYRRELRAAPDVGDDKRRTIVAPGIHDDSGPAEHAIERRLGASDLADVLQGDFIPATVRLAHEPEVGQKVAIAREAGAKPDGTAAPEQ